MNPVEASCEKSFIWMDWTVIQCLLTRNVNWQMLIFTKIRNVKISKVITTFSYDSADVTENGLTGESTGNQFGTCEADVSRISGTGSYSYRSFTWNGCSLNGRIRSISISMILSSFSPDCLFGSVILTPFLQDSGTKKCLPGTFIDSKVPNRHCCLTISCS